MQHSLRARGAPGMARSFLLATLLMLSNGALAGEVSVETDGVVTWQSGVDGPKIEWNADGSFRRISSRYSTPVEFADRQGIYKAQIIAEEKAKAAIISYIKQDLTASRVVNEIQEDLNKATQERTTGTSARVSKTDTRTIVSNLTEVTTSAAAGSLRGVIVLEKGFNTKTEEAWVVVGISDKRYEPPQVFREE
jgi:hypothetical protein